MSLPDPRCVVKVGDGRGFVIEQRVRVSKPTMFVERRLIVTAAHCLPNLPPRHPGSYAGERTFAKLLASLDDKKKTSGPSARSSIPLRTLPCSRESDAYFDLVNDAPVLRIGTARSGPGWVLSLQNQWVPIRTELGSGPWGAWLEIDAVYPGMSGSPILNDSGRAIGVITMGQELENLENGTRTNERAFGQAVLMCDLPARFLSIAILRSIRTIAVEALPG